MRRSGAVALVTIAIAAAALLVADGRAESAPGLPEWLSQTGLYDETGEVDPRNAPFSPQYPLWSDGAGKSRWIYLPGGTRIDASDIDAWRFPPGTKLWKEFSWNGRKVETRMLWKPDDEWLFATYVWNDDQTDARLAPESGIPDVVEVAPGKRHSIPSVADCHSCHLSSPAVVLGFTALQLSDDRDPLAPHAEPLPVGALTLSSLLASDRLEPQRWDLVSSPPRVRESSPVARAAIGYLSANCGGCHNDTGQLARVGLDLLHDAGAGADAREPVHATAVDAPGRYVVPGHSPESSRLVAPAAPERSAVLFRMQSRRPSSQMPPLGTVLPDREAIDLVRGWIEELEPGSR